MKKILGAAIAASMLVAGAANAAIDDGSNLFVGNGEVALMLWDNVAKHSVLVDTGFNYDDIVAGVNQSTNVKAALDAAFGSNLSNVTWNAASAGNKQLAADYSNDYTHFGALFTGTNVTYNPVTDDVLNAYPPGFQELLQRTADNSYFGDGRDRAANNYYVALTDSAPMYLDNGLWGSNSRYAAWNTSRTGSGDLNTYWMHMNDLDGATAARTDLGKFSLDLASGSFTYNSGNVTSEVPVPAAAWLLVSGLAGLGTISRRRKQA